MAIVGALAPYLHSLEELDRRVAVAACYTPSPARRAAFAARYPTGRSPTTSRQSRPSLTARMGINIRSWRGLRRGWPRNCFVEEVKIGDEF